MTTDSADPPDARISKVGTAEILQLLDRMEKVDHLLEGLQERTNTLVRLVDLMGRRVDRLEQAR